MYCLLQSDVVNETEDIFKLGLLITDQHMAIIDPETPVYAFQHKLIQELVAAIYICEQVSNGDIRSDKSYFYLIFESWAMVLKFQTVVRFVCYLLRASDAGASVLSTLRLHFVSLLHYYIDGGEGMRVTQENQLLSDSKDSTELTLKLLQRFEKEASLEAFNNIINVYPDCGKSLGDCLGTSEYVLITKLPDHESELQFEPAFIKAKVIISLRFPYEKAKISSTKDVTTLYDLLSKLEGSVLAVRLEGDVWRKSPEVLPASLQQLSLTCSLGHIRNEDTWADLGIAIHQLNHLTHLSLGWNFMRQHGAYIAHALEATSEESNLKYLDLGMNFFPEEVSPDIMSAIRGHRKLEHLLLFHNTLSGCVEKFMEDPPPELRELNMQCCYLLEGDLQSISNAIEEGKLKNLQILNIIGNNDIKKLCDQFFKTVRTTWSNEDTQQQHRLELFVKLRGLPEKEKDWELKLRPFVTLHFVNEYFRNTAQSLLTFPDSTDPVELSPASDLMIVPPVPSLQGVIPFKNLLWRR